MRIAVDARLTDYSAGGIPEYIQQLSTRLPKLDNLNEYIVLNELKKSRVLIRNFSDSYKVLKVENQVCLELLYKTHGIMIS